MFASAFAQLQKFREGKNDVYMLPYVIVNRGWVVETVEYVAIDRYVDR